MKKKKCNKFNKEKGKIFGQLDKNTIYSKYNKTFKFSLLNKSLISIMNTSQNEPTCKKIQNYIFRFADLLGQGNFSKVYKAHNQVTNETVAIKIVELNSLKSKKLEQLLFSEIEVLKKLNHPNILRCFEVFTSNRNCYIITELCNDGDLESKLRRMKTFSEQKAIPFIRDIFLGLEYLSEKNVIHRDLKVANIFLHNGRAKIADFGFAKFTKTKFKDINIGSPIYMSPQGLIQNIYGPKTDVWSFGIMIYELLHGETPFSHCKTQSELKYSMSIPIGWSQLKADLSSEMKEVILKCLEVKEDKRFTISQLRNLDLFKRILNKDFDNDNNTSWVAKSFNNLIKGKLNDTQKKVQISNNSNIIGFNWKDIDPFHQSNQQAPKTDNYKQKNRYQLLQTGDQLHKKNNAQSRQHKSSREVMTSISRKQDSSLSIKQNRDRILSSDVTFKACVNILHYCRLIYKFVTVMQVMHDFKSLGDQNRKNLFIRWLAIVVKTVNTRIDNHEVIYEGENAALRQQKLKEVSKEYEKKYSKQLNLNLAKINPEQSTMANYEYMGNYLFTVYQEIDSLLNEAANRQSKNLLIMGHYIIMIYEASKSLKKCYDQRDYKQFESYKDIETLLNMKKDQMDLPSYWWYKKKYITGKK